MSTETKLVSIDSFDVNTLSEIQGKKELQEKIVADNPFIKIEDTATFELAKQRRTALRTARTDLEKEEKIVISKIREKITEPIKKTYQELIGITTPKEVEQQAEVTRWEQIKLAEKKERERIEEERKEKIKSTIKTHFDTNKRNIENLTFVELSSFSLTEFNKEELAEFEDNYEANLEMLKIHLAEKRKTLEEQENIRIEKERLENERKEIQRVENIKKSVDDFHSNWKAKIDSSNFQTVNELYKNFLEEKPLDCQELQSLYTEKRALLVKSFEEREELLSKQEEQRIEQEKFQQEKEEFEKQKKISERTQQLQDLGFGKDLVYSENELNIMLIDDDLLCDDTEWNSFISETTLKIEESKKPKVEEIEVIEEEITNHFKDIDTNIDSFKEKISEQNRVLDELQSKNSIPEIIRFAMYITGHDEDTLNQMYNDWIKTQ